MDTLIEWWNIWESDPPLRVISLGSFLREHFHTDKMSRELRAALEKDKQLTIAALERGEKVEILQRYYILYRGCS